MKVCVLDRKIRPALGLFLCCASFWVGCTVDNARNHYVLAEKLWTDRNYAAAVAEFEKVILKDPRGKLGQQANYRAAMTQYLFLSQYGDAVRKFKGFTESSQDARLKWEAELQIGEILFSKLEQYDQAILHYLTLLKVKPASSEAPEFLFRIGKGQFFLFQFSEAVKTFKSLMESYPRSKWAEKASFEIGVTYFTRGEQHRDTEDSERVAYQTAMESFEAFIKRYPLSEYVSEAKFWIASCLEERDQLGEAFQAFAELKESYPSPHVIQVKLNRIQQRLAHRGGRVH